MFLPRSLYWYFFLAVCAFPVESLGSSKVNHEAHTLHRFPHKEYLYSHPCRHHPRRRHCHHHRHFDHQQIHQPANKDTMINIVEITGKNQGF